MSAVVTPALAAVDTEALRTEWALNIAVSMPIMVFSYLAIVEGATALCGLIVAINNFDTLLASLRLLVAVSYARSVFTGHNRVLCGKEFHNFPRLFGQLYRFEHHPFGNIPSEL